MSTSEAPIIVRDDRAEGRFVAEKDGAVAELHYDELNGRLLLLHTETPEALRGQGVGGQLVRAAVARAAAGGLTILPWCPFARRWLKDHPDVAATAKIDFTTPPPGA